MIRELAENPNVYMPLSPGRELYLDPGGRFVIFFSTGIDPHSATIQRVRFSSDEMEAAVGDIRTVLKEKGRTGAEWELGESCTPTDLVARLADLGIMPDEGEPLATGMVLRDLNLVLPPPGVVARRVATVEELILARCIQNKAFGQQEPTDETQAQKDFKYEGVVGSTFISFVDGEPAAAAYASYTAHCLLLFGGATAPEFRRLGAYRALVAARAKEAIERGTPVLVTHAGRMSRPILDRLGFKAVCRIDRLLDVF